MPTPDELQHRASEMRRNPTEPEKRFWRHVSNSRLGCFKFRRQQVIGFFIVDFFCPSRGLIVEIDGDTHDQPYDARRDGFMVQQGFQTIRFTNTDVMQNMDGVLQVTLATLQALPPRTGWRLPHPNPSPKGEGLRTNL
ncbi:endonuclease domain-containing protein [Sphingomonas tabacisoli]|uniref:Endonuclease domain-containing protein n=1 Tax=Sphingomonas tabacisoli TaxID=2249466 RepID=A0ABW4I1D4_9SPHN